jgi:hypothetical protein
MISRANPCLVAVRNELDRAGVEYEIDVGRHIRVRWRDTVMPIGNITVSISPSDWRAPRAARADCRRLLRKDGYSV